MVSLRDLLSLKGEYVARPLNPGAVASLTRYCCRLSPNDDRQSAVWKSREKCLVAACAGADMVHMHATRGREDGGGQRFKKNGRQQWNRK